MALQVVRSQVISFNCLPVIPVSFLMVSSQRVLGRPLPLFPLTSPSVMSFSRDWLRMMCPKYNNFCLVTLASSDVHGLIRSNISWLAILAVHGNYSSRLQHQSSNASILLLLTFLSSQVIFGPCPPLHHVPLPFSIGFQGYIHHLYPLWSPGRWSCLLPLFTTILIIALSAVVII